ncbi:MAG TPA: hypothetical protein PLP33_07380 [Leptospiraceae bacterium]|nr:hypothetical protein [Leptospiraceae bacterium]
MSNKEEEITQFNPDLAYRQLIEKRKQEMLFEQSRPQVQYYNTPQQNNRGPKFDPELDTKMTFDRHGNPLTINGQSVEELESIKNARLAAKLGMENTPEAIRAAKTYHKEVLRHYKQGVPAHLQMYGINEWAPSKEVKKYASMVDLGDEAGNSYREQTRQIGEHIARKWGQPDSADALMHNLNHQQQRVVGEMVNGLASGQTKFLHNPQGEQKRQLLTEANPIQYSQQQNQVTAVREGSIVYKILDTTGMPLPCSLARPIIQYSAVNHGMLTLTGRSFKTFIVQNEQARIDVGVINNNPQFIKEVLEVVDSRGQSFVVEKQQAVQNNNFSSRNFINDQIRPQQRPIQPNGRPNLPPVGSKFLKG